MVKFLCICQSENKSQNAKQTKRNANDNFFWFFSGLFGIFILAIALRVFGCFCLEEVLVVLCTRKQMGNLT